MRTGLVIIFDRMNFDKPRRLTMKYKIFILKKMVYHKWLIFIHVCNMNNTYCDVCIVYCVKNIISGNIW